MPAIKLNNEIIFDCPSGVSILDAASRTNILLPYSCKTGRCSSCKCKVTRGVTAELREGTGLAKEQQDEGWVLSCIATAETDLEIEVEVISNDLPQARTLPCRVSSIRKLTSDVVEVLLRLPPSQEFKFLPGQYVDLIGPNGIRRSYSLANIPESGQCLELQVRAVRDGQMTRYWFDEAKENDLLRINGPLGTFFLREVRDVDLIFLATGTGIAPVKSMVMMLNNLPDDSKPRSVKIFWGARRSEDFYFDPVKELAGCDFFPVLSRFEQGWEGKIGYVQDVLLSTQVDLNNSAVYACGSDSMIQSARAALIAAGLPVKRFYSDAFVSSGNN